jgi:hypothetical protein
MGNGGLSMKLSRLIVGVLLTLLSGQIAVAVSLFIASFIIDDYPTNPVWHLTNHTQLVLLFLSTGTYLTSMMMMQVHAAEAQAEFKRRGGTLKAMFSPSAWDALWAIRTPYAPRWMGWLIIIVILSFVLHLVVDSFWSFEASKASNTRLSTGLPLIWGVFALPILYSKWRELSQPAASASPEVRPS